MCSVSSFACIDMNTYSMEYTLHLDGLVQDCSISIVNALEILQSCTNPSIYTAHCINRNHPAGYHHVLCKAGNVFHNKALLESVKQHRVVSVIFSIRSLTPWRYQTLAIGFSR